MFINYLFPHFLTVQTGKSTWPNRQPFTELDLITSTLSEKLFVSAENFFCGSHLACSPLFGQLCNVTQIFFGYKIVNMIFVHCLLQVFHPMEAYDPTLPYIKNALSSAIIDCDRLALGTEDGLYILELRTDGTLHFFWLLAQRFKHLL